MTDFKKLTEYSFPKSFVKATKEEAFWKSFDTKLVIKENGPINHISVCDVDRNDFAVCSSYKIDAYCSSTFSIKKSFTKFKDHPYCSAFRSDGKVLVAGDGSGLVQIFDYSSKNVLRELKKHTGIVRGVHFGNSKTELFSVSDDKTLRFWDIAVGEEKSCLSGHSDYVRALSCPSNNANSVATGGYDHTVKLWDMRSNSNISFNHSHPVESITFLSCGTKLAASGGNTIKIWDLIANKLVASISNHQKTVTCLSYDEDTNRLFAGSLDKQIKVMNATNFSVVYGIKFSSPLISMGVCPSKNYVVGGSVNGSFMVKASDPDASFENEQSSSITVEAAKKTDTEKIVVSQKDRQQLTLFDKLLKKFCHSEALNVAFHSNNPQIAVAMLEELHRRGALEKALSSRDEGFVEKVIEFAGIHIKNPVYSLILIEVVHILIDTYSPLLGQSAIIDEAFTTFCERMKEELNFQIELKKVHGMLDIINANH